MTPAPSPEPALTHPYVDDEVVVTVAAGVELWRSIAGLEGRYEVSTMGRIRSVRRWVPYCGGARIKRVWGRICKQQKGKYLCISVLTADGQRPRFSVHRLVAQAFVANPDNKPTVNHKDGCKRNNHATNLEWATMDEQYAHVRSVLRPSLGERNPRAKITLDDVYDIRSLHAFGARNVDLAQMLGVDTQIIKNVLSGRTWRGAAA